MKRDPNVIEVKNEVVLHGTAGTSEAPRSANHNASIGPPTRAHREELLAANAFDTVYARRAPMYEPRTRRGRVRPGALLKLVKPGAT
jgi:hypothetical protein